MACSRPAAVKTMRSANAPNFAEAFARSRDCVSDAATTCAECPALRSCPVRRRLSASVYGPREFSSSQPSGVRMSAMFSEAMQSA